MCMIFVCDFFSFFFLTLFFKMYFFYLLVCLYKIKKRKQINKQIWAKELTSGQLHIFGKNEPGQSSSRKCQKIKKSFFK